uniref:Glutathione transferase n=1 Tax=Macrostomum lignano TaxID=282301 RepID=A0A1I8JGH9_9PLAT
MTEKYKLIYFPIRFRAEGLRWTLAYSGLPWEDKKIMMEEWAGLKPTVPSGILPCLVTPDGRKLVQSAAIARFLAVRAGIYPAGEAEQCKCDELIALVQCDLMAAYEQFLPLRPQEERRRGYDNWNEKAAPRILGYLDGILADSQSGYLIGDEASRCFALLVLKKSTRTWSFLASRDFKSTS